MKTLLKLVVMALIVHASWRIGSAYWDHYQFEDAVKESAQFSERKKLETIQTNVMQIAERLEIPIQADQLTITKTNRKITVEGTYSRDIEVLPVVALTRPSIPDGRERRRPGSAEDGGVLDDVLEPEHLVR